MISFSPVSDPSGIFRIPQKKIATNVLSDRLKKLEKGDILLRRRDPANARKVIYMPTEKCLDLVPPIMELLRWGAKYVPESNAHENLVQRFEQDPAEFVAEIRKSCLENEANALGTTAGDTSAPCL